MLPVESDGEVLLFIVPLPEGLVLSLGAAGALGLLLGDAPVEPVLAPESVFVPGVAAFGVPEPLSLGVVVVLGEVVVPASGVLPVFGRV
jgi:hypothetical protein